MKLIQNKIESAEVLNISKYNVSNSWDVYGDKQKNKLRLTKEPTVKGQTVNCRTRDVMRLDLQSCRKMTS
jgi:hypothetical protein